VKISEVGSETSKIAWQIS